MAVLRSVLVDLWTQEANPSARLVCPSTHLPIQPSGTTIVYLIKIKQIMLTNWISWLALCAGRSRGDLLNNPCNINRARPQTHIPAHSHTLAHTHTGTHPHMTWLSLGSSPSGGQSIRREGNKKRTWLENHLIYLGCEKSSSRKNQQTGPRQRQRRHGRRKATSANEVKSKLKAKPKLRRRRRRRNPFGCLRLPHSLHT